MTSTGLLIALHPSSYEEENARYVETLLAHDYPVPTAVGLIDKDSPLQEAISQLEAEKVDQIVLVPVYPSVINVEIQAFFYRLGLCPSPMAYYDDSVRVTVNTPIRIAPPLQDQPEFVRMNLDRALELAGKPEEEACLIIIHGSLPGYPDPGEDTALFAQFTEAFRAASPFAANEVAHVYPRSNITATARGLAEAYPFVNAIPYFIGRSRFTEKILPNYLKKAQRDTIRYTGRTILDHPLMRDYVVERMRDVTERGLERQPGVAILSGQPADKGGKRRVVAASGG